MIDCVTMIVLHGSKFYALQVLSNQSLIRHTESQKSGRQFVDDIFKNIFLSEAVWIKMKIN